MIVISPHLDDAVFSVGQIIAAHPGSTIVTVFAGIPPEGTLSTYNQSAGFTSNHEAVIRRRKEDENAAAVLRAQVVHGPFLDDSYKQPERRNVIVDWLRPFVEGMDVMAPVGISHPDHIDTHVVAMEAAKVAWLYEELPYRVHYPANCAHFLGEIQPPPTLVDLPSCDVEIKRRAVECYRSQLNDMMRRCVFVPERVWRLP